MIDPHATSEAAIDEAIGAMAAPAPGEVEEGFPEAVVDWLARLRLLEGVPFDYLVPHPDLLPLGSIRFFYLDRNWLDAAIDGALALGGSTNRDRLFLESVYERLRDAVDAAERKVWARRLNEELEEAAAEVVTGFLMRSRIVSGWPGMHLGGYRTVSGERTAVRLLRVERLAPAVLLVLMDGVADEVELEEPRTAAQLGVDPAGSGRTVKVRDPATGEAIPGRIANVPFRPDAPGVIDMSALGDELIEQGQPELGDTLSPAELGLQLLQYPYRQVFGARADVPMSSVLDPTVPMDEVRASQEL